MPELLGQRFTHLVVREAGDALAVRVNYLDDAAEVEARLTVGSADFRIREAAMRVHRGPGTGEAWPLEELRGKSAYLGAGGAVRRALAGEPTGVGRELFLEALKGVLQAEAFVGEQRGFKSADEYEQYFARTFANSCVYYSHFFHTPLRLFYDYVADQDRHGLIFNRYRQAGAFRRPDGGYDLQLHLMDSFHQMRLALTAGPDRVVTGVEALVRRCPDPVCRRGEERAQQLVGARLAAAAYQDLGERANGGAGCSHLADLAQEGGRYLDRLLGEG